MDISKQLGLRYKTDNICIIYLCIWMNFSVCVWVVPSTHGLHLVYIKLKQVLKVYFQLSTKSTKAGMNFGTKANRWKRALRLCVSLRSRKNWPSAAPHSKPCSHLWTYEGVFWWLRSFKSIVYQTSENLTWHMLPTKYKWARKRKWFGWKREYYRSLLFHLPHTICTRILLR